MTRKEFLGKFILLFNTLFIINKVKFLKGVFTFSKMGLKEARFYRKY